MDEKLKQLIKYIHEQKDVAHQKSISTAEQNDMMDSYFQTGKRKMCMDILEKVESLIFTNNKK